MKIESIQRTLERGITSLKRSLWWYWPASGDNEVAERNVTAHIAHALLRARWCVFTEASFPYRADKRIDLLAIQVGRKTMLVGECKLLHDGTKAASLASDAGRLRKFRLSDEHGWRPPISARYGLLMALTWNPRVSGWWAQMSTLENHPERNIGEGWRKLAKTLNSLKANRGVRRLSKYRDKNAKKAYEHWLLYAIFKLPR